MLSGKLGPTIKILLYFQNMTVKLLCSVFDEQVAMSFSKMMLWQCEWMRLGAAEDVT